MAWLPLSAGGPPRPPPPPPSSSSSQQPAQGADQLHARHQGLHPQLQQQQQQQQRIQQMQMLQQQQQRRQMPPPQQRPPMQMLQQQQHVRHAYQPQRLWTGADRERERDRDRDGRGMPRGPPPPQTAAQTAGPPWNTAPWRGGGGGRDDRPRPPGWQAPAAQAPSGALADLGRLPFKVESVTPESSPEPEDGPRESEHTSPPGRERSRLLPTPPKGAATTYAPLGASLIANLEDKFDAISDDEADALQEDEPQSPSSPPARAKASTESAPDTGTPGRSPAESARKLPTREEILRGIQKLEQEILKTERRLELVRTRKRESTEAPDELETDAASLGIVVDEEPDPKPAANMNLMQRIYAENSNRSGKAARALAKALGVAADAPAAVQPLSEQPLVVAGEAAHTARRPQIMRVLQERNRVLSERRAHLASIYLSLEEAWLARVTRLEQRSRSASGPSRTSTPASQAGLVAGATAEQRAAADANMRRPGRGRGDLVHSEEEMNQILRNLQQEDLDDDFEMRYKRTLAVVTPMELDPRALKFKYLNHNGYVPDSQAVHEERQWVNPWADEEKALFVEKYLESPKNFGRIASFFDNKTTAECVQFYYMNKGSLKLKRRVRQMALKRKRFRPTTNMADAEMDREPSPEPVGTPVLRDLGDFNVAVAAVAAAETMDAMQTDAAFDDSTGDASAALGGLRSDRTSYADADMPLDSLRQGSDAVDGQRQGSDAVDGQRQGNDAVDGQRQESEAEENKGGPLAESERDGAGESVVS